MSPRCLNRNNGRRSTGVEATLCQHSDYSLFSGQNPLKRKPALSQFLSSKLWIPFKIYLLCLLSRDTGWLSFAFCPSFAVIVCGKASLLGIFSAIVNVELPLTWILNMNSKTLRRAVTNHFRKKWFSGDGSTHSPSLLVHVFLKFGPWDFPWFMCVPLTFFQKMLFWVLTRACPCGLRLKIKLSCLSSPLDFEHFEGRCAVFAHTLSPCCFPFWPPRQPPAVQGALRLQHEEELRNLSLRIRHLSTMTGLAFMKWLWLTQSRMWLSIKLGAK